MKTMNALYGSAVCLALLLISWAAVDAGTISYTYDPAGRLVAADYGGGKTTSYAYDSSGNLLQTSEPSPGLLMGQIVNGQLSITWPSAPGGFTLEFTTILGPAAVWQPVGAMISQTDNLSSVTVSAGPATTYYRLRK
jgi:YD repeat-containing protein